VSSSPGLEVLIKSILDAKGFEDLQKNLADAQTSLVSAGDSADDFKTRMGEVGDQLVQFAATAKGGQEAIDFFKDALKEAISGSEALERFAAANAAVGDSSEESKIKNEEWLRSVEESSGVAKEELVPVYQKLLAATNDSAQAQSLMQIALGASARGMGETSEVTKSLTSFLQTGTARGFGPMATEIKRLTAEGKTQKEVLEILTKQYGDAGAGVETAAMQVKRAELEWKNFKESVGALGLSLVQYLKPAMEVVAQVIVSVITGAQKLGGYLGVLAGSAIPAVFGAITKFIHGDFKGAIGDLKNGVADVKSGFAEVDAAATKTATNLLSAFNRTASGARGLADVEKNAAAAIHTSAKDQLKALQDLAKQYIEDAKLAAQSAGSKTAALLAEAEGYKKVMAMVGLDEKTKKAAEVEYQKLLVQTTQVMLKQSQTRNQQAQKDADAQKAFEAKTLKDAEAAWNKHVKQMTKDAEAQIKARHMDAVSEAKALADLYGQMAALFKDDEEDKTEYAIKESDERKKVIKDEAELQKEVLNGMMDLMSDAFGASKEVSIAKALINTYEGVSAALALTPPYSYVLAAITLAEGLMQVSKIESTAAPTKKGFDNPTNDFAAMVGGQRWARDMIEHFSAGAMAGFKQGMVTNNNQQVFNNQRYDANRNIANYNIKGIGLLDSASNPMMRKFVRTLQVVGTQESQRTPR
jgi:hypothetical protein